MPDIMSQGFVMFYLLLRHTFRMMYWVLYPGVIVSGLVSLRFRHSLLETVKKNLDHGTKTIALAALLGLSSTAGRKRSLLSGLELFTQGLSPSGLVAYLIATHSLVLYALTLMMVLLGIEFALGQLMGATIMIILVRLAIRLAIPSVLWESKREAARRYLAKAHNPSSALIVHAHLPSWRGLALPATWGHLVRYLAGELRAVWLGLGIGYLIGGFLLVAGLQPWWIDLATIAGGGIASDLLSVVLAPFMAVVALASPVGNLPIASNLFKSDTLAFPGLVTFVLASLLNPRSVHVYVKVFGWKVGWRLTASIFLCAALSGLLVTGLYALVGFRPGHVPLFRDLVDKIIMWLPFTMPSMGMPIMMNLN